MSILYKGNADVIDLPAETIHVWRASLGLSPERISELGATLSAQECKRADRFQSDDLRDRYRTAHGILRGILGRYLEMTPERVTFSRSETGKPTLSGECAPVGIGFSMAVSESTALFALVLGEEVGVDVEAVRELSDMESVAETTLTPGEQERFGIVSAEERARVFFQTWTVKEAVVKATGEGVAGLQRIESLIDMESGRPVFGVRELHDARADAWTVHLLDCCPGFAAAAAVPATGWECSVFTFDTA